MKSLIFVAVIGLAAPVLAADSEDQSQPKPDSNEPRLMLGLGAGTLAKPYAGLDSEIRVLPMIFYENRYVRVGGLGLEFKAGSLGNTSFAVQARYGLEGYEEHDASTFAGMSTRHGGIWLGPTARWRDAGVSVFADIAADASGHSKGLQARLGADKTFSFGRVSVTPTLAATWLDSRYVDYYYGVRTVEATASRAAYAGESTVNLELGLRNRFILSASNAIVVDFGITQFGSGITDSPLVDRNSTMSVRLGFMSRF